MTHLRRRLAAILLGLLPLVPWTALLAESSGLEAELQALLDRDAAAWNRGDFEAFVSTYAEDATFVSPSGLTRGRQAVLERYRAKYGKTEERGRLELEVVEARELAPEARGESRAASVLARWRLTYPDRPEASGWTLLVFERSADGAWRIVQDASF